MTGQPLSTASSLFEYPKREIVWNYLSAPTRVRGGVFVKECWPLCWQKVPVANEVVVHENKIEVKKLLLLTGCKDEGRCFRLHMTAIAGN